jgi:bile acid:Na+ symporter, BASS family
MKKYAFTIAVIFAALVALAFPQYFIQINGFPLKKLIIPLIQIIMLGMGSTMSVQDFTNVARMPKAVLVGLVCQFTIMPGVGFALANLFSFPQEIAAGIILIGCSPSGLASNVMAYIAKANVALSITITSLATLLSPLITPALMKLLAGQFIEVHFMSMMLDIFQMIIVPIILGLVINKVFRRYMPLLNQILPVVSMIGIALIIIVVTAAGREALLTIGGTLILVVLIHNLLGFTLGYWGARLAGLAEQDCRTVALEVGLQNAGVASGLALQMGKMATVGLAAVLFGPIMNINGSLLATWWSKR